MYYVIMSNIYIFLETDLHCYPVTILYFRNYLLSHLPITFLVCVCSYLDSQLRRLSRHPFNFWPPLRIK